MQKGMTTVMEQAMVQPIVPRRSRITFTTKSITFLLALCVSRMRPNRESYEGGSAENNVNDTMFTATVLIPFGSTASSYEGGGPLDTPWWAGTVPGMS